MAHGDLRHRTVASITRWRASISRLVPALQRLRLRIHRTQKAIMACAAIPGTGVHQPREHIGSFAVVAAWMLQPSVESILDIGTRLLIAILALAFASKRHWNDQANSRVDGKEILQ
jgi:hypothetical protein